MFTGIITDIGVVAAIIKAGDWRLRIATRLPLHDLELGASVACSGACLTVIERGDDDPGERWFDVQASAETLRATTISSWNVGRKMNLEAALRVGDALGGHFVSGHVDGLATVETITPVGDSHALTWQVPAALAPFIAPKGSITLDGVSLTVNRVEGARFTVNIIPHTWQYTTLSTLAPGDAANVEIDVLARYAHRFQESTHAT